MWVLELILILVVRRGDLGEPDRRAEGAVEAYEGQSAAGAGEAADGAVAGAAGQYELHAEHSSAVHCEEEQVRVGSGTDGREEQWTCDSNSVTLALHTLQTFELRDVDLFEFVKRCVMPYVDDPSETIRSMAVSVACKVGAVVGCEVAADPDGSLDEAQLLVPAGVPRGAEADLGGSVGPRVQCSIVPAGRAGRAIRPVSDPGRVEGGV